jgi:hypothetical protein
MLVQDRAKRAVQNSRKILAQNPSRVLANTQVASFSQIPGLTYLLTYDLPTLPNLFITIYLWLDKARVNWLILRRFW